MKTIKAINRNNSSRNAITAIPIAPPFVNIVVLALVCEFIFEKKVAQSTGTLLPLLSRLKHEFTPVQF